MDFFSFLFTNVFRAERGWFGMSFWGGCLGSREREEYCLDWKGTESGAQQMHAEQAAGCFQSDAR